VIFVNFKTYKEATGKRALDLTHKLCDCQDESGVLIYPVVQIIDARVAAEVSGHEVWVQHVDPARYGEFTGWTLPEAVFDAGIKGVFLNHSEHKLKPNILEGSIARCREVGLETLVFAADVTELREVSKFKPNFVAYEPPELIASEETSVARAKPEIIKKAVAAADKYNLPLLVGAGVKDIDDVKTSLKLGAAGIAVSSAVVLAQDPKEVVMEMAEGFK